MASAGFTVVMLLPPLKVYKDLKTYGAKSYTYLTHIIRGQIVFFFILIAMWAFKKTAMCTTIGPNHHQIWNCLVFLNKITEPFYVLSLYVPMFMIKGDLSYYLENVLLAFTYTFSFVFYHQERFSVWCWTSGILVLLFVMDPQIVKVSNMLKKKE